MFRIFGRCSACLVLGCRKCSFDLVSLFGLCGGGGGKIFAGLELCRWANGRFYSVKQLELQSWSDFYKSNLIESSVVLIGGPWSFSNVGQITFGA